MQKFFPAKNCPDVWRNSSHLGRIQVMQWISRPCFLLNESKPVWNSGVLESCHGVKHHKMTNIVKKGFGLSRFEAQLNLWVTVTTPILLSVWRKYRYNILYYIIYCNLPAANFQCVKERKNIEDVLENKKCFNW